MNRRFEPNTERLRECLRSGLSAAEAVDPREELALQADADDRAVARALVRVLGVCDPPASGESAIDDLIDFEDEGSLPGGEKPRPDSSFLGRLTTAGAAGLSVEQIEDVPTLVAVIRAGSLVQRRAALKRLGTLLKKRRTLSGEAIRTAVQTIGSLRDVELAYELAHLREELSGAPGRKARAEREEWKRLVAAVQGDIVRFWDGQLGVEPVLDLPGDQRAQVLLRLNDLPDTVVQHLLSIVEGTDGTASDEQRVGLLASLRYATDVRLVPSLVSLIETAHGDLLIAAARAIGDIEDPRVHPALVERFERAVVDRERVALAGALGTGGDGRGLFGVREVLAQEQPDLLRDALEEMESLGGSEDSSLVARFLDHLDVAVATQAIRTLARIGDGRVLEELSERYNATHIPALRAQIEDALASIAARMELRGEEAVAIDWSEVGKKPAVRTRSRDRLSTRFRGWRYYLMGQMWLVLGRLKWAVARFEAAAAQRTDWAAPLLTLAMVFTRRDQHALALPAFRRAIEVDRDRIERNPILVRSMARAFLRRAEEVAREGRDDIARGLVDEALTLDLRRAPSAVRFELERLRDLLRREDQDVEAA